MHLISLSLLLSLLSGLPPAAAAGADPGGDRIHRLARLYVEWAGEQHSWVDGYGRSIAGERIGYHSPLPGVDSALLSRATDGSMRIVWETASVSPDPDDEHVRFVWLAGINGQTDGKMFELSIDDEPWFTFSSSTDETWEVSGSRGGRLRFESVMTDMWGDHFGYMVLELPPAAVNPGEPIELAVVGEAAGSMAWYMVFEHDTAAEPIRESERGGFWYRLLWQDDADSLTLVMPRSWSGRTTSVTDRSGSVHTAVLRALPDRSEARMPIDPLDSERPSLPLVLALDGSPIDRLDSLGGSWEAYVAYDDGLFVMRNKAKSGGRHMLESSGNFAFDLASGIGRVSESYFGDATIHLITSSHQDIAWMDSPQSCVIMRDTLVLTPALELLARDTTFHYSAEQALMLWEYLGRHPGRQQEIARLSREGRIEWGATYNQPYEGMYSGESLARQLYLGRKWLRKTLPGYDPRTAWSVDVPGRTLQMPQILKKAGVDYLVISRFERGLYWWESPDGSRVGTYSPGHYHVASDFMRQESAPEIIAAYPDALERWEDLYRRSGLQASIPVLVSSDMSPPRDYSNVIQEWNRFELRSKVDDSAVRLQLPQLRYDIAQHLLDRVFEGDPQLPVVRGERPNLWLYIHGPTHHRAVTASREAARLLTAAETFSTISAVLYDTMDAYPDNEFANAWEAQIYPDHGWGGKNGHITDNLFLAKSEFARDEGVRLLAAAQAEIAAQVDADTSKGRPVVVFNDLSWNRTGPAGVVLSFAPGEAFGVAVTDPDGAEVAAALHDVQRTYDGSIRTAVVTFVADDVPSIGLKTFYVRPLERQSARRLPPAARDLEDAAGSQAGTYATSYENDFYRIDLAPGGIEQIHDKELERDLFRTDRFLAGELFTLRSEGNGAGEFARVQLPSMEGFNQMRLYPAHWKLVNDTPIATTFTLEQEWPDVRVRETLTVYNTIKRLDLSLDLLEWDGTEYREFRLAWPLNMRDARVAYEVPFGVVEVGKSEMRGAAGERYDQPVASIHPREVMDWVGAWNDEWGFTMSSSVAVFDYLDPTEAPADYVVLQPVLLASRKSCHWEGNWYLQKGDHHYEFSFTSHRPDWRSGHHFGKQATHPLRTVEAPATSVSPTVSETTSFAGVSAANVLFSTIKKAEDDDGVVVRVYELEGEDSTLDLDWFTDIRGARVTDLIEENARPLGLTNGRVRMEMGHHAIETIKLDVARWGRE